MNAAADAAARAARRDRMSAPISPNEPISTSATPTSGVGRIGNLDDRRDRLLHEDVRQPTSCRQPRLVLPMPAWRYCEAIVPTAFSERWYLLHRLEQRLARSAGDRPPSSAGWLPAVGEEAISASTLGMPAPIRTTNGACLTPRSRTSRVCGRAADQRLLHHAREVARFVELVVERDGPDDVGQVMHRRAAVAFSRAATASASGLSRSSGSRSRRRCAWRLRLELA